MRIHKILMESRDPDMLAGFYQNIMELPVSNKAGEIEIIAGSSSICFRKTGAGATPFYHFAINIPGNKIEEARTWLSPKVELLWMSDYNSDIADFRNWNAKSIYFYDPAGNIVELIARHELNNDRSESFSSNHLLSISEIGIVYRIDEIERNTEALMRRNGLDYFSRQPPFAQFKAVGDDEGLFIIVTEARNWYPTEKSSGRFPLEVEFEVDGKLRKESF